jgi:hypothetical protein
MGQRTQKQRLVDGRTDHLVEEGGELVDGPLHCAGAVRRGRAHARKAQPWCSVRSAAP